MSSPVLGSLLSKDKQCWETNCSVSHLYFDTSCLVVKLFIDDDSQQLHLVNTAWHFLCDIQYKWHGHYSHHSSLYSQDYCVKSLWAWRVGVLGFRLGGKHNRKLWDNSDFQSLVTAEMYKYKYKKNRTISVQPHSAAPPAYACICLQHHQWVWGGGHMSLLGAVQFASWWTAS